MSGPTIICVFGISGVGKTTAIAHVLSGRDDAVHFTASGLIKLGLADPEISSEALRLESGQQIRANQRVLTEAFKREVVATSAKKLIFDGHLIIDRDEEIIEIPLSVVSALHPNIIFHIEDEPTTIAQRRVNDISRQRPFRSPSILAQHQERSKELCRVYAESLGLVPKFVKVGALTQSRGWFDI